LHGSEAGDLVALFNGYRIAKSTNKRAVRYGDEEWSDFRKADVKLEKNTVNERIENGGMGQQILTDLIKNQNTLPTLLDKQSTKQSPPM
jgi:hypothetical protein